LDLADNSVDLWQCVIFRSEICRVTTVYLKREGKQRLWLAVCTWGSDRIDLGVVSSAMFWREAYGWQKPPGIPHGFSPWCRILVNDRVWKPRPKQLRAKLLN
jgi:hypothetical protein